ncbi:MAG TPA: signal peptide peptidase SppA [Pyrinomonadaceae bacterium]|jgi:protease-4|nr:signal peptide peptidase SppA [Pyrinomonadaceae bacterium]
MAMSRRRKILLIISGVVVAFLLVLIAGVALIFAALRGSEPTIKDNSVLALRIGGPLPDYVPEDPFRRLLGGSDNSLTDLLTQIKKAKVDKRIGAIILDIHPSSAGWAKADEIREAIADFRTSGKPIYAYMEYGLNKEYYIATACDRIYMAPPGDLFINGLAAQAMFFRGSLDKLGIYPDVYQIGKYKNAPDSFTRKEMSESHREVINSFLDDFMSRIVNAIATTRKKSPEDVRALIDQAPFSPAQAQANGLIDGASYREEVEQELKKRLGYKDSDKLRIVRASEYREVAPESVGLNKGERIAVIYASGSIDLGKSEDGPRGGQSVGSDTVVKAINDARDDQKIRAIVLRVDSPGGSSYASDLIWRAVESAKQKKPVVVSMSDLAASGGYYIACNANKIVAEPSTLTGSIGIFAGKPVVKGFYDWLGISTEYVLRGKNAGMFRETEPFTPEERARFEEIIKSTYYDEFVPKVARGRNREPKYIDSIAQGRVWTGEQAKANGLVDEFGGLERAVEIAKQLANIPADKGIERVIFPYPRSFIEGLFDSGDEASAKAQQQRALIETLPEDVQRAFRYAQMLDRMQRGETMALMPFELQIK